MNQSELYVLKETLRKEGYIQNDGNNTRLKTSKTMPYVI